jgi:hypothetical protein
MNDGLPPQHDPAKMAKWVALAAVGLLLVTNIAWIFAYSALSQKVVGVISPTPSVKNTPKPSPTPTPPTKGDITGSLSYPGEEIPAMSVCAVNTTDASKKYCVDHKPGTATVYDVSAPAGTYYVYASLQSTQGDFTPSYKAYYNKYVTCGMQSSCPAAGHTQYIPVTVTAGMTTDGISPGDWYAM